MARKAQQRISYVLPLPNCTGGHRLGVNSLAVDKDKAILYSAGRDGVICSWDVTVDLSGEEPDAELTPRPHPLPSSHRSQTQAHTHWVNDLALCDSNNALVSCSSDLTVKLWRPHSDECLPTHTIGVHSDYVKCLAAPDVHGNWVASGGLDRKIKVWDLNGGGEKLQIDVGDEGNNPKGSVYSLAIGGNGSILASGGPESVVRIWDSRSGQRVTKFVGHTDNIRSILVSEQGNLILTGSSDMTIKLWSLKAGRCLHTLNMHSQSVWSLYSNHPELDVFWSSDRSGLVAKTDLRGTEEVEEGLSVYVAQEESGVSKVVATGDYVWTATSSSNINRWIDADTDRDVDNKPPITYSKRASQHGAPGSPTSTRSKSLRHKIPINSLLSLSTSSPFASTNVRDPDAVTVYSIASVRQSSMTETLQETDNDLVVPINDLPNDTIKGQHGLIKHFMLNDRRTVLTLDTAGEVTMWDLLKCIPVKSFGKRHLEDVAAEVNTVESIANWCQVDTRTGRLACVLDENYCFDAEMYADEAELDSGLEFRDDQRINLGRWVLRYLFSNLIDEEIVRDEEYRKKLEGDRSEREKFRRENAPPQISLPSPTVTPVDAYGGGGSNVTTPIARQLSGYSLFPQTPGMSIGIATPAPTYNPAVPPHAEDTTSTSTEPPVRPPSGTNGAEKQGDYFSSTGNNNSTAPPKSSGETSEDVLQTPTLDDKSMWGKWRHFGNKKLGRSASTDMGSKAPPLVEEKTTTTEQPEETVVEEQPDPLEDTLAGVIKRLRQSYDTVPYGESLRTILAPSLPSETPVLKPPHDTAIMVQEDRPGAGGVADLYRGTVGCVGEDADLLEKVAPAWLGDLLLHNRVPLKETVKVSFVLIPWQNEMPVLPSESASNSEGKNSRLNANRMLRAKKIMAYVAEHLQPPYMALPYGPEVEEGEEPPKPEEWLELLCDDQIVPVGMTLATIKRYVWKLGGDVVLYYRKKNHSNHHNSNHHNSNHHNSNHNSNSNNGHHHNRSNGNCSGSEKTARTSEDSVGTQQ